MRSHQLGILGAGTILSVATGIVILSSDKERTPVITGCIDSVNESGSGNILTGPINPNEITTVAIKTPLGAKPLCHFSPEQDSIFRIEGFERVDENNYTLIRMTARNILDKPYRLSGSIHFVL